MISYLTCIGFTNLPYYTGHNEDGVEAQRRAVHICDSAEYDTFKDVQGSDVCDIDSDNGYRELYLALKMFSEPQNNNMFFD